MFRSRMRNGIKWGWLLLVSVVVLGAGNDGLAAAIPPLTLASIFDQSPPREVPDQINVFPTPRGDYIRYDMRFNQFVENRAIVEFDVTPLAEFPTSPITLDFDLGPIVAAGHMPELSSYRLYLYEGDGMPALSDFWATAIDVGAAELTDVHRIHSFSLDMSGSLRAALDSGVSIADFRFQLENAPTYITALQNPRLTIIPEPSTLALCIFAAMLIAVIQRQPRHSKDSSNHQMKE